MNPKIETQSLSDKVSLKTFRLNGRVHPKRVCQMCASSAKLTKFDRALYEKRALQTVDSGDA